MITKVFAQGFFLLLAISLVTCLSIPPVVAQTQTRTDDGDVNRDGRTTPADALCVFQRFLGLESCLDSLGVRTLIVNCAEGETIVQALQVAHPGDTIQISGTCNETVTITTDALILDGQNSAIIDGEGVDQAVMTIDGARRVTLQNITVRNGSDGILVRRNGTVIVTSVTAENNTTDGIRIAENATAVLQGTIITNSNGRDGLQVSNSSNARLAENSTLMTMANGDDGIQVSSGSNMTILNSIVQAENNGASSTDGDGITVTATSTLALSGTNVSISQNTRSGLLVANASSFNIADDATFDVTNNGGNGVVIERSSSLQIVSSAFHSTNNNQAGLSVSVASEADCGGGTRVILNNGVDFVGGESAVSCRPSIP